MTNNMKEILDLFDNIFHVLDILYILDLFDNIFHVLDIST
jgi:hypothetical protein